MRLFPQKGSVLVFSLIILSIILSAAITVATVSITNQRSASSTGKSVQSFQVADSGIELALQKIYKNNYTDLNAMATGMGGGASCSGGTISKNNVVGGNIKVSFYDNDGNLVACTATDWRDKVVRIKSEGSAFGTTRVVETAVAAAGGAVIYDNPSCSAAGVLAYPAFIPASATEIIVSFRVTSEGTGERMITASSNNFSNRQVARSKSSGGGGESSSDMNTWFLPYNAARTLTTAAIGLCGNGGCVDEVCFEGYRP